MEIFAFSPDGAETIDAFNGRLAAFAAANNVTGVVSSTLDSALVLSLTLEDDLFSPVLIRPFVSVLPLGIEARLELELSQMLDVIRAEDGTKTSEGDDITSQPIEVKVLNAASVPHKQRGYAVFLITVGELEMDG